MRDTSTPPYLAILLISSAALAYEVLLLRLFSIIQWHHFAYMMISLALLGYGASGTFLTLFGTRLSRHFDNSFLVNAVLFSISSSCCFLLAQRLPFNTLEMFIDRQQWLLLLTCYLLLFIPFFFAANCICLAFARFSDAIPRIYAVDLIGAGLGALGVVAGLYLLQPQTMLQVISSIGMLASALAVITGQRPRRWQNAVPYLAMALIIVLLPASWFDLKLSQYKALNQALQIRGASLLTQRSGPLGLLTVVENRQVPLRLVPGLSLNNRQEPLAQIAVFVDGDGPTAISRYQGDRASLAYLDFQTSALPYHLQQNKQVLVLGAGGGSDLLQALYHQVEQIEAVEINPQLTALLQQDFAEFAGWRWYRERSRFQTGDVRGFAAAADRKFPQIQLSMLGSSAAAAAGVQGLNESYVYTREAFSAYLDLLQKNGLLTVTRWLKLPPRDGLKLFATAVAALRAAGVTDPGSQLIMIRGWATSTLIMKNGRFDDQEIHRLKEFCDQRSFDIIHHPGMDASPANRYNILPEPYFQQGVSALLGPQAERFIDRYKFDIRPATDDRPFFYDFFKWSTLPEILRLYREGGFSLLELGYPVLVLTLLQSIVASLLLILLPLLLLRRAASKPAPGMSSWVLFYFLVIGLAFLLLEMAFIQKFILYLADPVHAFAVVLCGFLVFSGLGSRYAGQRDKVDRAGPVLRPMLLLSVVTLLYLWLLPALFTHTAHLPAAVKTGLSLLLIAPLAFCMGMPFPLGLSRLARSAPGLVPWAWGINGCASLVSAILAALLAVHVGFTVVILTALVLYLCAAALYSLFPDNTRSAPEQPPNKPGR